MQFVMPVWNLGGGGAALSLQGNSHNVTDGYAFWNGVLPAPMIYTGSVIVTASGGTPPYTYLWTEVGGPSGILPQFPTAAMTNFREQDASGPWVKVGQFICTVTDALAATATWAVDDVTIEQST